MSSETEPDTARVGGGVFLAIVAVFSATGLFASFVSFDPAIAMLKLAAAFLQLAGVGHVTSRWLGLRRPRVLAAAQDVLVGQVVAVAYVYVRSSLSELLGLPGISVVEVMLAQVVLWSVFAIRHPDRPTRNARLAARSRASLLANTIPYVAWLAWMALIASWKLGLHYTPSSDPDIHAFYAKITLERGHLFYDLLPISDAWMIYPSAFSTLSLVWGRLSGLHAVQLVNIAAYLQFALFTGLAFALLVRPLRGPVLRAGFSLLAFAIMSLCFAPVYVESRAYLEGTPRLAHTALLFYPVFFVLEQGLPMSRRPWLALIPWMAVLIGLCVNPTHAPASLLAGAIALALFVMRGRTRGNLRNSGWGALAGVAFAGIALAIVVLASDPFYRSLAMQQLDRWPGEVEAAEDLTGDAMRTQVDWHALGADVLSDLQTRVLPGAGQDSATSWLAIASLCAFALCILLLVVQRSRTWPSVQLTRAIAAEGPALSFAAGGLLFLVAHGLWCIVTRQIVEPGVLQSVLLVRYGNALQNQASLAIFSVLVLLPVSIALGRSQRAMRATHSLRAPGAAIPAAIAIAWIALSASSLVAVARSNVAMFHPKLRESPLGIITASDVSFLREVASHVPADERILLPGRLRRTAIEHWIFSTGPGRGLPLFTDARTSFFLGLDGRAFTPDAYEAHVGRRFDDEWLRSQRVLWLLESGNFAPAILRRDYELVMGNDRANLWRLVTR